MKKGLSLIEVMIAITLFSIVAILSSTILIDIVQLEKKSSVQNSIYEDLRIMLQLLTKEIQSGTIDYDEYFSYCVIQEGLAAENVFFGINHGVYGSRFYDPGKSLDTVDDVKNPKDLGLECSYEDPITKECKAVYTLSTDINVGRNPFYGGSPDEANAFKDVGDVSACKNAALDVDGVTDHLFLIDSTGTQKTIIAKKQIIAGEYAIGLMKMKGFDVDQNGFVDTFTCLDEFNCNETVADFENYIKIPYLDLVGKDVGEIEPPIRLPQESDLSSPILLVDETQFVPISPLRANVIDLQFIIQPLEDPYKAFAEPEFRAHPTVTIILTVGLSDAAEEDYPGEFDPITVQTTVAAGVLGRIETYPPVSEIMGVGDEGSGWMDDVKLTPTPF
jgi:prepilin-type N-terminal cleavage/methylation domain-containing protein